MISRMLRYTSLFALAATFSASVLAAESDSGSDADVIPLNRVNPDYPRAALRKNLSGWVRLSFTIAPDGTVTDVIPVVSSNEVFERNAVVAVSRWTYDPAAANLGATGGTFDTIIRFTIENATGPSQEFARQYGRVDTLLNEGNLDEAADELEETLDAARTLLDDSFYHWLAFRYFVARGDTIAADNELAKMMTNVDGLPEEFLVAALYGDIGLAIDLGHLHDARAYIEYLENVEFIRVASNYESVMQQLPERERLLEGRLASSEPIEVVGTNFDAYWFHTLNYREFSIGNVQGELKGLQVRCRNANARQLEIQLDSGLKLPDAWGKCSVYVEAEPGTRFVLTEYPPEPAATIPAQ